MGGHFVYYGQRNIVAPKGLLCRRVQKSMFVCPFRSVPFRWSRNRLSDWFCDHLRTNHEVWGSQNWSLPIPAEKTCVSTSFELFDVTCTDHVSKPSYTNSPWGATHALRVLSSSKLVQLLFIPVRILVSAWVLTVICIQYHIIHGMIVSLKTALSAFTEYFLSYFRT